MHQTFLRSIVWLVAFSIQPAVAARSAPDPLLIQKWVLDSVAEMPEGGAYSLKIDSPTQMNACFTWKATPGKPDELALDPINAIPSYCTTATYMAFYKVLQKYWAWSLTVPTRATLERLKPNLENDGARIWGRWNSNGPGTAKFAFDAGIAMNFDDLALAQPGDFLKIYWNSNVGKLESAHSVIFLGTIQVGGVEMIQFWSSNRSTHGYGEKRVPRTDVVRMLFTRLDHLENFEAISSLPEVDAFLESMLVRESTWDELKSVTGIKP